MIPKKIDIERTKERIRPFIHHTPVMTSTMINDIAGCDLYFKCDNFQKGGSYKIRGATNAVLLLSDQQRAKGLAAHSSGNFAQALAIAAKNNDIPAYIVMPENAPKVKVDAVKLYGAKIIFCSNTLAERESTLEKVLAETEATSVHPYDDLNVILGQSTLSVELIEEVPNLDYIISPIGGGGVGAGACLACHYYSRHTRVVGGEPVNADDAFRSLQLGKIQPSIDPDTIADGLRTQLGEINFPIIKEIIDEIIRVPEEMIIHAMRLVWERMKILIEPSSAIAFAAVLLKPEKFVGKKIGLLITGGNVTLDELPF